MSFGSRFLGMLAGAACCAFGACAIMPVSGPQSRDIESEQSEIPYALVRLSPTVNAILAANAPRIAGAFTDRRGPQVVRIGIGDLIGVTIYETGAGLFVPNDTGVRPGNFLAVPPQAVDADGNIAIPSAGPVRAKDRTVGELQHAIVEALKDRALEPQAVVSLLEQRSSSFTVLGDVRLSGQYPVKASGERLLDAIGQGGGLTGSGNESWVVLERAGKRAAAPFGALVDEPKNNIFVRPGDTIYVFREPQTFLAFGASDRQGQFPFEAWHISLSEAMAKAEGLSDASADAAAVFIYRGETRHVAGLLGVDTSRFEGPIIPIIYNVSLRDPGGYFLTSKFEMRNKDVIYVSNAQAVESTKFLNYLRTLVATVNDPINAAIGAYTLKGLINGTGTTTTIVTVPPAIGH